MPSDPTGTSTVPAIDAKTTGQAYREAVGHELRSPLTVIRTALGTLTDDLANVTLTEDMVRMLEIALRNTRRLEDAIERHLQELEQTDLKAAAPAAGMTD